MTKASSAPFSTNTAKEVIFVNLTVHIPGFGQMFGVPNAVVDQYLKLATPSQLKVLLYLLRNNGQTVDHSEIAKALAISEELVEEAALFWSQTDLFAVTEPAAESVPAETAAEPEQKPAKAPRTNHVSAVSSGKSGDLTPLEIASAIEASDDLKTLFRMSEQQLGRPLRHVEQKALVWMHDYNNIGSDIILTVLLYCKSIDKSSVSYAESIITSWWNDGIQTLPQVTDAINDLWQDRKIPLDLITYAYEKTLESIDKLSFPYLDSILTRWMNAGYRTRTDVDTKDRPETGDKKAAAKNAVPKSDNAEAYQSFIRNLEP